MTVDIQFLADNRKNIANYPGILTLNPFINAKNITHALYQNMGDEVAHPVDIDTVDDAPERVHRGLIILFRRIATTHTIFCDANRQSANALICQAEYKTPNQKEVVYRKKLCE